jgi:hypothetical protein
MTSRNALLGQLHAVKRDQRLDDDTYRDKLFAISGRRSAAELTDRQLESAIAAFRPGGVFHGKQKANNSYTAKFKALYLAAFNLGALDDGSDAAIAAFAERQTGKRALQFLDAADANRCSEALKAIMARHGLEVPGGDAGGLVARRALLRAQWARLHNLGAVRIADEAALDSYVSLHFLGHKGAVVNMSAVQLDQAAKALGRWIRQRQSAQRSKAAP